MSSAATPGDFSPGYRLALPPPPRGGGGGRRPGGVGISTYRLVRGGGAPPPRTPPPGAIATTVHSTGRAGGYSAFTRTDMGFNRA